ncbi:CU044_5270 family protein [Streptomyces corynorhini]|uniref:CU044_5270 family protein n=1 Tax=Streptomyces corynorhini TaxID=2282652 RepID=A0A370AXR7_9ACTN|nr:CU044_5270 family protein [Streptomyces corynorhini]RDG31885.1 hypothetical protein DVH02_32995 [Streptomyces corynorhini]
MNADRRSERADVEDVARLLPAPAERDLPPDRHLHHKDLLMQRIDHDQQTTAARPVTEPPARRLTRPAVLLPAAALALSGALVATLVTGGDSGRSAPAPTAGSVQARNATVLLDRIAAASLATDATPVRDDQFVYVRSVGRGNEGTFEGPVKIGAPYERESWMAQDPEPVIQAGAMRTTGKGAPLPGQLLPIEAGVVDGAPEGSGGIPAGIDRPTYAWLASLPTDPGALRTLLYAQTRTVEGETKDAAVFDKIGDLLLDTVMPPANAAAFYKVAATIPGVIQVPDAVDAAGRHGAGITLEDTGFATRDEWIFDKESLALLGARQYINKSWQPGDPVSTLYGTTAIMERAVVDKSGEVPAKAAG